MKKLKRGKRTGLVYFDMSDLRSWKPCYDPSRHIAEDFRGTAVSILENTNIPVVDRLWVVLRTEIVSEKTMRLFAVWCARQVQHLMTDKRSLDALDVAERFANGRATQEELDAASDAAYAAYDAARAAAYAAYDAARAAAYAASDAASDAARAAAYAASDAARAAASAAAYAARAAAYAAYDAARAAASAAAYAASAAAYAASDAAYAASDAARAAAYAASDARDAAYAAQIKKLIEMVRTEGIEVRKEKHK